MVMSTVQFFKNSKLLPALRQVVYANIGYLVPAVIIPALMLGACTMTPPSFDEEQWISAKSGRCPGSSNLQNLLDTTQWLKVNLVDM